MIEVVRAGMLDLVMDRGRPGFRSQGVPEGGAADSLALILANRLVGNPDNAAGLEMLLQGPRLRFVEGARVAIIGAGLAPRLDGVPVPLNQTLEVEPGGELDFGVATNGLRACLAISGGIGAPLVLGSRSTFLPGGFGGWKGRALRIGDVLSLGTGTAMRSGRVREYLQTGPVRIMPGPQLAGFADSALQALTASSYIVSNDCNRSGIRLSGQALNYEGDELPSQAVLPGAIQVPPSGQPIILGWDGPVTGGYPVIAGIVSADLHRLAQLKPGDEVSFRFVGLEEVRTAAHGLEQLLDEAIEWED